MFLDKKREEKEYEQEEKGTDEVYEDEYEGYSYDEDEDREDSYEEYDDTEDSGNYTVMRLIFLHVAKFLYDTPTYFKY